MTFYAPSDQIDQVDYAMENGVKMLEYMEAYFDIPYPLPKAGKRSKCLNSITSVCLNSDLRGLYQTDVSKWHQKSNIAPCLT